MYSIELFAGAGGLATGLSSSGFKHLAIVENNPFACSTLERNAQIAFRVNKNQIARTDARDFEFSNLHGAIDLVSGGPPCQPFSIAGKHRAQDDIRDMFPEAIRAIRELQPKAFIFENVTGLLRKSFSTYFSYILLQLQHPSILRSDLETWDTHNKRLQQHHTSRTNRNEYNVVFSTLNAADFGVPQVRKRLFIVGFRSDIDARWSFPAPTHSRVALHRSMWVDGDYWERHCLGRREQKLADETEFGSHNTKVSEELFSETTQPWRTVRDAFEGLSSPLEKNCRNHSQHVLRNGARTYRGHTGSSVDGPAKTLKAGHHGVPGGENILRLSNGSVRYFTIREAARLQTFPDEFEFEGSWTQVFKQLGNAVPVQLANVLGQSIYKALKSKPK